MNERDDARQIQIAKGVIAHGVGAFSDETLVPVIGMQSISDFDVTSNL